MTYGLFLGVFLVVPIAACLFIFRKSLTWRLLLPFAPLLLVVYAATTPWDNAAVAAGLWDFGPGQTWGIRLIHLPLEEYLFFGLQTLLTGLLVAMQLRKLRRARP